MAERHRFGAWRATLLVACAIRIFCALSAAHVQGAILSPMRARLGQLTFCSSNPKVEAEFSPWQLGLSKEAVHKLIEIVGPRYAAKRKIVRLGVFLRFAGLTPFFSRRCHPRGSHLDLSILDAWRSNDCIFEPHSPPTPQICFTQP